jgi:hypothetical protein
MGLALEFPAIRITFNELVYSAICRIPLKTLRDQLCNKDLAPSAEFVILATPERVIDHQVQREPRDIVTRWLAQIFLLHSVSALVIRLLGAASRDRFGHLYSCGRMRLRRRRLRGTQVLAIQV